MSFCPLWVMGVVSVQATRQYILKDVPLPGYASKYGEVLEQYYDDAAARKIMSVSEEIMKLLVEIEAEDIGDIFDGYIYYTTSFDEKGSPRKIKSLFKNAFAPEDTESRVQDVFTSFKVYTFKYRSDPNLGKPSDWDILDVDKIGWLGDLMEMKVSYNDAFDASF
ncbi:MAG: hypothetical protein ISQ30_11695 [Rhodobacteraceae bacterium]|nr:hypothetical protein [Paracoccaceae bacterium]MBL6790105.1 hypothetical protein [Paracoccaceae bacterium]